MIQPPHHISLQVEHRIAEFEREVGRERLLREAGVVVPLRLHLAQALQCLAQRLDPELRPKPSSSLPSFGRWVDRRV
jgi:hypothetical protein